MHNAIPQLEQPVSLSLAFVAYLKSDEMILPADAYPPHAGDSNDDDDEAQGLVHDDALDNALRDALSRWDAVTIKVDNLVSPSDADWMMPFSSAKCRTVGHVYMALKSSSRVQDYLHNLPNESIVRLHVQQWVAGPPSGEWRCYTRGKRLMYAGQRYPSHSIEDLNLASVGTELDALWNASGLGEMYNGFFQLDIWVMTDGQTFYILGASEPDQTLVERSGVFSWEELVDTPVSAEGGTVVRALTGRLEMSASSGRGVGVGAPEESAEAFEELREQMANMAKEVL